MVAAILRDADRRGLLAARGRATCRHGRIVSSEALVDPLALGLQLNWIVSEGD
jgi:hypothetical protein